MSDDSLKASVNPDEDLTRRLEALHQHVVGIASGSGDEDSAAVQPDAELAPVGELFRLMERVRHHTEEDTPRVRAHDTTYPSATPSDHPLPEAELADVSRGRQLGRFTILRKLGDGGYGFVFLARDGELDREIALKVPRPEAILTEEMRARFLREGKAAALLSHPYIVPVFETGYAGRVCYIVSRYVDGITLAEWLTRHPGKLDPRSAAQLVAALAEAVQHAHSKAVIHRDLKPANVLLEGFSADTDGSVADLNRAVRITDFGLAKTNHDQQFLTGTGSIIGTPAYMSPEQAAGVSADARADTYALGAILYELLTGNPPHANASILQTLRSVQEKEPVPPSRRNRLVPRDLEAICLKCLEKEPSRRYDSANQLQNDLERFLSEQPVLARPISKFEYTWRWCRRNPALAVALSALLLSITVGGALVAFQVRQLQLKNKALLASNDNLRRARDQEAATVEFLANSFVRPDPTLDGRQVTLASLLDRNLKNVKENAEIPSNTRASLAFSLGRAYHGLGLFAEAIDAFKFSHAQWTAEMDETSPFRLDVISQLGLSYVELGRYAEAVEVLTPAAATSREQLGESDRRTTVLLNHLALAYQGLGNSDRALAILRKLYEASHEHEDRLSEAHLQITANLGDTLAAGGRFSEAVPLQEKALERSRAMFGDDDPRTLQLNSNLAASYTSLGRPADALSLMEEVLAVRRAVLGEDHLQTLKSENNLAGALMTLGEVERAVQVLSSLVPRARRIIGADHPSTLGMTMNLGGGYLWLGRPREAAGIFESVWGQMRAKLGDQHPHTLKSYELLGRAHADTGALSEAESMFRELIEIEHARPDSRPYSVANLQWLLGGCLLKQRRFEEAEAVLRESVQRFAEHAPGRWQMADAKSLLGATLMQLGRRSEGEKLLIEGQRELHEHAAKIPIPRRQSILETADQRMSELSQAAAVDASPED